MNIFILDTDPKLCAEYHCDKHLCKMVVEHTQILGSIAWYVRGVTHKKYITPDLCEKFTNFPRKNANGAPNPYSIGYINHPCTKWARECIENYEWLCKLTLEMFKEYTTRYKRKHTCESIVKWYMDDILKYTLPSCGEITSFVQAMPDDVKREDVVEAYRSYYIKYKYKFAKWNHTKPPYWWKF